jgi:hypothetical protein
MKKEELDQFIKKTTKLLNFIMKKNLKNFSWRFLMETTLLSII